MKRRAVTTEDINTMPAEPANPEATIVPIPPPLELATEPIRRSSRLNEKAAVRTRSKSVPAANAAKKMQSNVQLQPVESNANSTTDVTAKELKAFVKSHGMQSATAVCPLIRESFRHCIGQREVAMLLINTAMELARQNRRKRVLVRDVEPLVTMLKQLFVIAGYGRLAAEHQRSV